MSKVSYIKYWKFTARSALENVFGMYDFLMMCVQNVKLACNVLEERLTPELLLGTQDNVRSKL